MQRTVSLAYDRLLAACGLAAGIAIAIMAVLITLNVALRNLGLANFPWLLEVSEYVLYIGTFMAAPWVLRLGAHVRVDLVVGSVPRPVARLLNLAADLAGAFLSAVLGWYGARIAWEAFTRGDLLFKEIVIPEWPLLVVIPVSGLLLTIEFIRRIAAGSQPPSDTAPADGP